MKIAKPLEINSCASASKKVAALFCVADQGHLNPLVALAEALVQQGWDVHFYVPKSAQQQVEAAGATWCHYGTEDWDLFECSRRVAKEQLSVEELPIEITEQASMPFAVVPAALGLLPYLLERMGQLQPRFIAFDSAAPWGLLLGTLLHLPAICSMTALPMAMAAREKMSSVKWSPSSLSVLDASSVMLRRLYGVQFNHNYSYTSYSPYTIIWSSRCWHGQGSEDFPEDKFHYWGPLMATSRSQQTGHNAVTDVLEATEATRPVVFVSLGTVATGDCFGKFGAAIRDFYGKVCRVAEAMPEASFFLSVGKVAPLTFEGQDGRGCVTALFGDMLVPPNLTVARSMDQLTLLRRANAFVTHCGQNSCSEAICAGVPVIACPFFGDQLENAQRFVQLGCGLLQSYHRDLLSGGKWDPDLSLVSEASLMQALRRLINEPNFAQAVRLANARQREECGVDIVGKIAQLEAFVDGAHRKASPEISFVDGAHRKATPEISSVALQGSMGGA